MLKFTLLFLILYSPEHKVHTSVRVVEVKTTEECMSLGADVSGILMKNRPDIYNVRFTCNPPKGYESEVIGVPTYQEIPIPEARPIQ